MESLGNNAGSVHVVAASLVGQCHILNGIVHSLLEFGSHLTKFTVIEELIEALPGGRVVARRVVQPVREHGLTALLIVHSLSPHLQLLSCSHQVADISPLVDDELL